MTPDEIIGTIKKSTIPTVCVEGVQDKAALRHLEKMIGISGSIVCCNGRTNLFEVWMRRGEFSGKKVAFLADRDLYVFGQIPSKYNGIIFTHGYSLENDILLTKRWETLLTDEDNLLLTSALEMSLNYYWHQCKMAFEAGHQPVWISAFCLIDDKLEGTYAPKSGFETCSLFKKITKKPYKYLRGHNLLECVHASLSHKKRPTKFGKGQIIEISVKPTAGIHLKKIVSNLNTALI